MSFLMCFFAQRLSYRLQSVGAKTLCFFYFLSIQGEEYKLFWPEQSEFIRMAARFGAKIVPFGVVGEDDISEVRFPFPHNLPFHFWLLLNYVLF